MARRADGRTGRTWRRVRLGIAALLLAVSGGVGKTTRPSSPGLAAEIARQVERAVEGKLGHRGLEPAHRETGELLGGERRSVDLELRRGERVLVVAACDEGCSDLDLELTDPDGRSAALDVRPDAFPTLAARVTRSGRYALEVAMADCAQRCRYALEVLVARYRPGATPSERVAEAKRLHQAALPTLEALRDALGRGLVRLDGFEEPVLGGGGQTSFEVEVPRAGPLVVAADCDFGCEDLDLFLEDASGDPIARDQAPDPQPRLWVEVAAAGVYRVAVRMEHCRDEPCAFAATVFGSAPPDPTAGHAQDQGSCFAVHPEGFVATAAHVVEGASSLSVHLADGSRVDATLHAIDAKNDLAVLRLPRPTPVHLPLAPAGVARLGLRVFTIGFPALDILGDDPKFSEGVVAGIGGSIGSARGLFQITVPVQPGNSGGALVTEEGTAVGVVERVMDVHYFWSSTGQPPQSVNYAARSELLARMLPAPAHPPPPVDRAQAIERARAAACWVEAFGEPSERRAQAAGPWPRE